ncbi:HEAT repeat domain-containing protein [Planctomycetota bacterium]
MSTDEKKPTAQARDQAAIEKLRQLTKNLCSNDINTARLAAFNLSWMQDDGLAILTQTLTGDFSRTTKKAAAYGLRSMKGRMKKLATEVLEQGLKHQDRTTKAACIKALAIMRGETAPKENSGKNHRNNRTNIKEVQNKTPGNPNHNSKPSGR